ncbi:methyltransferase domain-containing protein [Acetobacteraceae bacterium]|nr:methyltransferase domain-containing protein [Candidatus Parcubacteria bacterium]
MAYSPKKKPIKKKAGSTSWGGVAKWYGEYLQKGDTYQESVLLPNILRMLNLQKGECVLDLACGEGYFAREFLKAGAIITGVDISPELIAQAKAHRDGIEYYTAPATKLIFAKDNAYSTVLCILALQNIADLPAVFKEVRRVLKSGGRFVMVINHPAFRVLKRSSWGFDEKDGVQYRRIDGYLSSAKIFVDMHPSKQAAPHTISYHRSLQDFIKALRGAGFAVTQLEEWISHRTSSIGPRQKAEDTARKEIPLFMALEAKVLD